MFKQYLQVTKPGIIFGNLISVIGGFLLASKGHIDYPLFVWTLLGYPWWSPRVVYSTTTSTGTSIVRWNGRKPGAGQRADLARSFAGVRHLAGYCWLYAAVVRRKSAGLLAGVMGFVVYVGVYSLYMKRHSVYGTLIGSLSGAAPPVIGYCAVTGDFDSGAAILLAIFSLWQMPHSYAIAIFRFKDYQAANIPVLPVVKGISVAKNHITLYIVAFAVATLMLSLGGYAGYKYLVVAAAVSVWWLGMALRGYKVADDKVWARKLFVFSIVAITALSVMMSVDFMVPDSHSLLAYVR